MNYTDFMVDRAQHMRPLEYDLSENYNALVRYLHDMGILENVPIATLGPGEILSARDSLAAPLRSLVMGGSSMQAGTPTPDAPVPIQSVINPVVMFAGKQLMDWAHPFRTGSYNYDISVGTTIVQGSSANVDVSLDGSILTLGIASTWTGAIWRSPNLPNGTYHVYLPTATVSGGSGSSYGSTLFIVDKSNKVVRKLATHATTGNWNQYIELTGDEAAICVNAGTRSSTSGKTFAYAGPQLEFGSERTEYEPYKSINVPIPVTLRGLPDGARDTATFKYLRSSDREGLAWYSANVVRRTGQTTQAATDGITGTVGVDVLSTTGEIADGPTVVYKLPAPITETLPEIELPSVFGPSFTLWGTADATPQLTAEYIRNLSASISDMQEAIADL